MKIYKFFNEEKALGLVEALIALAVVGTGMVLITYISLKTIRRARQNELQDVAVQAGVEAIDFMKDPADIVVEGGPYPEQSGTYYKLDFSVVGLRHNPYDLYEIDQNSCSETSYYLVGSLFDSGYTVCQQIKVTPQDGSTRKFNIEVIVVWQTVGGGFEKRVFKGFRVGGITI